MSTHIVQFGKHRFVCGLFWQSLSRPRELRHEAVELARKISLDLMVIRKEQGSAQAGFAHTADGVESGMLSLAAAVAHAIGRRTAEGQTQAPANWLGAFKLPGGKWAYFAVRDESFLPNGDFAGTREEVLERLHGDYGLGGWNAVIGDKELEEFGFHHFRAEKIENLLERTGSGQIKARQAWALRAVSRKLNLKTVALVGTAAAVLALGAGAYMYYKHKQEEEARELAMEQARAKLLAGETQAPHPWPKKPLPQDLVKACLEKMKHLSPGGWTLDEYVCDAGQVSYKWARANSTVDYLLSEVPKAVVDLSGDKASWWEPVTIATGKDEPLSEAKQLLMPLLSVFQGMGLTLKITAAPPPPPPSGMQTAPPPIPGWQTFNASLAAQGVPLDEIAVVLTRPGIRLEKLSYRNGEWLIEGVIYAK